MIGVLQVRYVKIRPARYVLSLTQYSPKPNKGRKIVMRHSLSREYMQVLSLKLTSEILPPITEQQEDHVLSFK